MIDEWKKSLRYYPARNTENKVGVNLHNTKTCNDKGKLESRKSCKGLKIPNNRYEVLNDDDQGDIVKDISLKATKNDKVLTGELGMSMYHIIKQHDLFHTIIWLGLSHLIFMVYVGFTCNFCRESRLMIVLV